MGDTKKHTYCVAIFPPGESESVNTYSSVPFMPFLIGDEVSRCCYLAPKRGGDTKHPVAEAIVARVVREVSADADEILDTTWVYLRAK